MAERPSSPLQRPVDARALMLAVQRLMRARLAPWLHVEVARRMAERLPLIRRQPALVIDWGAGIGGSAAVLRAAYPRARIERAEPDGWPVGHDVEPDAPRRWWRRPLAQRAAPDPSSGAQEAADLLWSNMVLHHLPDVGPAVAAWRRAVSAEGFLMFSTLGPGTLAELRAIYAERGWPPPMAPFEDMHDLGDRLVAAGFADPVMDQETLTLTWPDARSLLNELRGLGANAHRGRFAALRGRRWRLELEAALEARRGADGRIALTFEVVYGHAFCGPPGIPVRQESTLSADELRAMARAGRAGRHA